MTSDHPDSPPAPETPTSARKNVLAGLMFVVVALLGLVVSRNYPVGTALRMGTGYVPRMLLWLLLGLGGVILVQGLRQAAGPREPTEGGISALRPLLFVTASLVVFGITIEWLGIVVSIALLIGLGALAARDLRAIEAVAAGLVLIVLSWAIFIQGLGLVIPIWPEW